MRFLVILGFAVTFVAVFWPYLTKIGLGRLPGDVVVQRKNRTFFFPFATCVLISFLFSAILWLLNR